MGSAPLLTLIFRPAMGKMVSKRGSRRYILLGLAAALGGTLAYSFMEGFYGLMLARILQGSGLIFFFFSSLIMIGKMVPAARRGELFGIYTIVFIFPLIFSPLLGSLIEREFSFNAAVFFSSLLIAFSLILAFFIEDTGKEKISETGRLRLKELLNPGTASVLALVFFLIFTDAGIISFLPIAAARENLNNFALYFSVFALSSITLRLTAGRKFDLLPRKKLIGAGVLFSLAGIFLITRFSFLWLMAAGLVYGIGFAVTDSNLLPSLMQKMNDRPAGEAITLYSIVFDFAYLVSPPVIGLLAGIYGFKTIYLFCGGGIAVSGLIFFLTGKS